MLRKYTCKNELIILFRIKLLYYLFNINQFINVLSYICKLIFIHELRN